MKSFVPILIALVVGASISGCGRQSAQSGDFAHHHETSYVSWGIDEFELFGLAKQELKEKFTDKLRFNYDYSEALFETERGGGPRFLLTFDGDKVAGVQRVFVDGKGCHIMGPKLTSQKQALTFSIEHLAGRKNPSEKDQLKLATAEKLLADLSK